jgi:hypothetical protein
VLQTASDQHSSTNRHLAAGTRSNTQASIAGRITTSDSGGEAQHEE